MKSEKEVKIVKIDMLSSWCILQKFSWLKFLYQIFLMEMV